MAERDNGWVWEGAEDGYFRKGKWGNLTAEWFEYPEGDRGVLVEHTDPEFSAFIPDTILAKLLEARGLHIVTSADKKQEGFGCHG
jgi:hypothetical protein